MNATAKRYSPQTNPVGPGKINRSITLTERADAILSEISREFGLSVNQIGREAFALWIEAKKSAKAIAFRAAMDAHNRQQFAAIGCLMLTGLVWWQTVMTGDDESFRKSSRGGRIVRTVRVKGRDMEVS